MKDKNHTCKVVVFANQKGGCGKTTSTLEFADCLHVKGYKVLVIDADPQGDLTDCVEADKSGYMLDQVIRKEVPPESAIQHCRNFDIIPTDQSLVTIADYLQKLYVRSEFVVSDIIAPLKEEYDFIVFDTAPSISLTLINMLVASDDLIIPATPDLYAIQGIPVIAEIVNSIKQSAPNLRLAGIVYTQYENKTNNGQTLEYLTSEIMKSESVDKLKANPFFVTIRKTTAVGDARTSHKTIRELYEKRKHKAPIEADLEAFVDEYLKTC